jgi:glycerate dehydrogenase
MQGMGMEILIAQSRTPSADALPLQEVLARSDVVSIHVPLTKETHHLIQRKELLQMKRSSFLINTARGGVVNEKDLADALRERLIAGAGVDVLSQEPPPADHPLLQPDIPHLLLTPHIGWGSLESRKRLLETLKSNIDSFLNGTPINLIK